MHGPSYKGYEGNSSVSHQTAKDIWGEYAATAPFLLALRLLGPSQAFDDFPHSASLTPSHFRSFLTLYEDMFDDRRYFEKAVRVAKWLQLRISKILVPSAYDRCEFVSFPEWVEPLAASIPPLTDRQRLHAASYTAGAVIK